jgi:hypothetical protein
MVSNPAIERSPRRIAIDCLSTALADSHLGRAQPSSRFKRKADLRLNQLVECEGTVLAECALETCPSGRLSYREALSQIVARSVSYLRIDRECRYVQ